MSDVSSRPVGASMLALLALLLSLLGFMAVLSLFLITGREGAEEALLPRAAAMLLVGVGFGAEALGFWNVKSWTPKVVPVLFGLIAGAAVLSAWGSGVVELGAVLVLGLAFAVNAVAYIYLRMPDIRLIFHAKS